MGWRENLVQARAVQQAQLDGLHPILAKLKERLDALTVEQDIHLEHLEKVGANLDFLRTEAKIVKLSEFKTVLTSYSTTNLQLRIIEKELAEVQAECSRQLKVAGKFMTSINEIDAALNKEGEIVPFHDKR